MIACDIYLLPYLGLSLMLDWSMVRSTIQWNLHKVCVFCSWQLVIKQPRTVDWTPLSPKRKTKTSFNRLCGPSLNYSVVQHVLLYSMTQPSPSFQKSQLVSWWRFIVRRTGEYVKIRNPPKHYLSGMSPWNDLYLWFTLRFVWWKDGELLWDIVDDYRTQQSFCESAQPIRDDVTL